MDGRSVESAGLFGLVGGRGSERLVGAATATERKGQWGRRGGWEEDPARGLLWWPICEGTLGDEAVKDEERS